MRRHPVIVPRRSRREPFRVYAEEDFWDRADADEAPAAPLSVRPAQRPHRLAALAILAGAVGTAGAVVVTNVLPRARDSARRARGRSHLASASSHGTGAMRAGGDALALARRPAFEARPQHVRDRLSVRRTPPRRPLRIVGAPSARLRAIGASVPTARPREAQPGPHLAEFGFER